MKIKTLLVALVAIVLAGFCAASCNKDKSLVGTTWKYSQVNLRHTITIDSKDGCTYLLEQYVSEEIGWSEVESKGTYILNGKDITFLWLTNLEYIGEWGDCHVNGNIMTVTIEGETWKLIKQ